MSSPNALSNKRQKLDPSLLPQLSAAVGTLPALPSSTTTSNDKVKNKYEEILKLAVPYFPIPISIDRGYKFIRFILEFLPSSENPELADRLNRNYGGCMEDFNPLIYVDPCTAYEFVPLPNPQLLHRIREYLVDKMIALSAEKTSGNINIQQFMMCAPMFCSALGSEYNHMPLSKANLMKALKQTYDDSLCKAVNKFVTIYIGTNHVDGGFLEWSLLRTTWVAPPPPPTVPLPFEHYKNDSFLNVSLVSKAVRGRCNIALRQHCEEHHPGLLALIGGNTSPDKFSLARYCEALMDGDSECPELAKSLTGNVFDRSDGLDGSQMIERLKQYEGFVEITNLQIPTTSYAVFDLDSTPDQRDWDEEKQESVPGILVRSFYYTEGVKLVVEPEGGEKTEDIRVRFLIRDKLTGKMAVIMNRTRSFQIANISSPTWKTASYRNIGGNFKAWSSLWEAVITFDYGGSGAVEDDWSSLGIFEFRSYSEDYRDQTHDAVVSRFLQAIDTLEWF